MLTEFDKLEKHLQDDLFNNTISGDTLYIIDDYNIGSNMSDKTLCNFVNSISNVKQIKKISIFIQRKPFRTVEQSLFNCSFRDIHKNPNYINKLKFVELFQNKGITCQYIVYPQNIIQPALHGRYWLSKTGGFIVDGSLNTAESKAVLVQVMDNENFNIIKDLTRDLFDLSNTKIELFDGNSLRHGFSITGKRV